MGEDFRRKIVVSEQAAGIAYVLQNRQEVEVTAKYSFADIPADIKQAVIEQALFMWRWEDLNFSVVAVVSSAVVGRELSPTFELTASMYRDKYGDISYFPKARLSTGFIEMLVVP